MAVKKKSDLKTGAIKDKSGSKTFPAKKSFKAPLKSASGPGDKKSVAGRKSPARDMVAPGTVIGVNRGLYKHYGIYAGRGMVIHYASVTGDFGREMSVRKTGVKNFLNGAPEFFVCDFPESHGKPRETKRAANLISSLASSFTGGGIFGTDSNPLSALLDIYDLFKKMNYKLYSPAETLRRAKSRLGEDYYNLIFNNCEHFVVWCKTGVSESHQVNQILKAISGARTSKIYAFED
jgi:hypothetical protein